MSTPTSRPTSRPTSTPEPARLEIVAVPGLPEVTAGDDVAALVLAALRRAGLALSGGDVVVVSSKIVSKAEGRTVAATSREDAVEGQTRRVVAERIGPRGVTRIVESRSGPVLAAAGVDASNVAPGTVLLLPEDPDASAARLRAALAAAAGGPVGVVVSDTAGRPWRDGQTDLAVGAAGVAVVDDLRGGTDAFGTLLEVTVRALADEVAAAADLVKGKLAGTPVAVVRGLAALVVPDDGPGARALLRGPDADWFALGQVEAVRASLGVPPGSPEAPPAPMFPGDARERLARAVRIALAAAGGPGRLPELTVDVTVEAGVPATARAALAPPSGQVLPAAAWVALGALTQRVLAAARAERLTASGEVDDDGRVLVVGHLPG
jgi:coenzyme F420-0:L-glutamate ligase/coenzyme F420-1:gamma-L-glutamate ligase